jgi:signal transduction histidine kinase
VALRVHVDEVMSLLADADPGVRLEAARMLSELTNCPPLADVRRLRKAEPDSWVRAALDRALARWEAATGVEDVGESWISVAGAIELEDVRAQAIESVTQTLIHEIRGLLRELALSARADLGTAFEDSSTARTLARLRDFLRTVQRLHDAAGAPRYVEFDLANLIVEEIAATGFDRQQIVATRDDTVIVRGDPELLRLALQNAMRNAVEASEATGKQVIVNCGVSMSKAWIVVLDEGIGLPDAAEKVWQPGVTKKSKENHFGWGLPIAQRAVHSLGGTIKLFPREHGGTACEIRWSFESQFTGTEDA